MKSPLGCSALALLTLICSIWIVTYFVFVAAHFGGLSVYPQNGGVWFGFGDPPPWNWIEARPWTVKQPQIWRPILRADDTAFLYVPFWIMLAPITVVLLREWRRSSTNRGAACECGYLLIGNVSGICPECGAPVGRIDL